MVNSVARTTVTVPPLNQPSPSNSITSVSSNSTLSATRQSSFAAALRKLAKQAGDTEPQDSPQNVSPRSTGNSNSREVPHDSSSGPPATQGTHSGGQGTTTLNSAPLVTIAPTPSHRPYLDNRKTTDVSPSSAADNPHIKQEQDKMAAMPSLSHDRSRDDDPGHHKDGGATDSRLTPRMSSHSTIGASATTEEVHRGFQPYRPGDDARHQMAAPYSGHYPGAMDPVYSAALAYQNAMLTPHPYSAHPAYRVEDPMMLERYRLLQSSQMFQGYSHPSMMGVSSGVHPYLAAMGNRGYPPELLAQHHMAYMAGLPTSPAKPPEHVSPGAADRPKSVDEQRREREKERDRERERERERDREREEQQRREREREDRERRDRERSTDKHRQDRSKERSHHDNHYHHSHPPSENHRKSPSNIKHEDATNRFHNHNIVSPSRRDPSNYFSAERLLAPTSRHNNKTFPSQEQPLNLHKTEEVAPSNLTGTAFLEKERERQRMHREFLREQDMLMHEREGVHNSRRSAEKEPPGGHGGYNPNNHPNSIHRKSPSHHQHHHHHQSSSAKSPVTLTIPKVPIPHHTNSAYPITRDTKPQLDAANKFHRPFEGKANNNHSSHGNHGNHGNHGSLANGLERDYSEYERRLLSERVLTQDHNNKVTSADKWNNNRNASSYPNSKSFSTPPGSGKRSQRGEEVDGSGRTSDRTHVQEGIQSRFLNLRPNDNQPITGPTESHLSSLAAIDPLQVFNRVVKTEPTDHTAAKAAADESASSQRMPLSKLDIEEKLLNEVRQSGAYNSDNSDSDNELEIDVEDIENKRQKLLLIASGPPLKPEKSTYKLAFLSQFGLTTPNKRKDEEFLRCRRRRRLYHERSVSPIEVIASERPDSPLVLPPSVNSDDLNMTPDYHKKAKFLYGINLEAVPTERQHELDMIRRVCDWDRTRRGGQKDLPLPLLSLENHFMWYQRLLRPQPVSAYPSPIKRRHEDPDPSSADVPRKRASECEIDVLTLEDDSSSSSQAKNTLGATDHHVTSSTPKPVIIAPKNKTLWKPNAKSAFSSLSPVERDTRRAISREFAQEFHESVLQKTRQQQQDSKQTVAKGSVEVHYTLDEGRHSTEPQPERLPSIPRPVSPVPTTQPLGPTRGVSLPPSGVPSTSQPTAVTEPPRRTETAEGLKWPGITVLIESYQRHLEEHRLEQNVLQDQCQQLQQDSRDLNRTAEQLSLRMAELLQNKQKLEEARYSTQAAIDNIKQTLKKLR